MFDGLRTSYGDFPIVISEIGGLTSDTNTAAMITEQQKLATGSGDASELTKCKYVARPSGAAIEADNTHFTGATNITRGTEMGETMATML